MKKEQAEIKNFVCGRTNPVLLRALALMSVYSRATGAHVCIHDHNYMPIQELLEETLREDNICRFCIRYRKNIEVKNLKDLSANPCREMHVSAVKESCRSGGSHTYTCPLGLIFWTSPIYLNKKFIGALMGSGFLKNSAEETCSAMSTVCEGAESGEKLQKLLENFRPGEPQRIDALTELMLICAKTLSMGSDGRHAVLKRRLEQQTDFFKKIEEIKIQYPPGSRRLEYPFDKEKMLLDVLRRGDIESAKEILNGILAVLFYSSSVSPAEPVNLRAAGRTSPQDQFKFIQYRAIELAVVLSRADAYPGFAAQTLLETNNRHIKLIQETKSIEELADVLHRILDESAAGIISFRGINHAAALKKAEYYILENFTRKISLDEIAKASGFSAPYFSTIFKEEMGENFSSYLNRLRVEKAGYMLIDTSISLSNIASSCGFEDQSWFSKIFKHYTGMSPGKYRNQAGKPVTKIPETEFSDDYLAMIS